MLTDKELYECGDCRLLSGLDPTKEYRYWTIRSGMMLSIPGLGAVDLWSDIVPCAKHLKILEEEG